MRTKLIGLLLAIASLLGFYLGRWSSRGGENPTEHAAAEASPAPTESPTSQAAALNQPSQTPDSGPNSANDDPNPTSNSTQPDDPTAVAPAETVDAIAETDAPNQITAESPARFHPLEGKTAERLEQMRKKNLAGFLKQSRPLDKMNPTLRNLLGNFEGDVLLEQSPPKTWQMTLSLRGQFNGASFQGESQIRLLNRGKVFRSSEASGNLKNLKQGTNRNLSVLIEIDSEYYFDAFYDGEHDSVYGNLYKRINPERVKYIGYVQLIRTGN